MSSVGFSELLILFVIGLIVLGPERLPRVASQIGSWIGQARRMTRSMKRQLEEELDFGNDFRIQPPDLGIPRDDDTYSPVHGSSPTRTSVGVKRETGDRSSDTAGTPEADQDATKPVADTDATVTAQAAAEETEDEQRRG